MTNSVQGSVASTRKSRKPDAFAWVDSPTMNEAHTLGRAGMDAALSSAERANPGWKEEAYAFLVQYARTHKLFISEDVSDASRVAEMRQPHGDRSWGSIYIQAKKDGLIEVYGTGRSRRRHGSVCNLWRSLAFNKASIEVPKAKARKASKADKAGKASKAVKKPRSGLM